MNHIDPNAIYMSGAIFLAMAAAMFMENSPAKKTFILLVFACIIGATAAFAGMFWIPVTAAFISGLLTYHWFRMIDI